MTRVTPLRREDLPELDEKFFKPYEAVHGYVPNSNLVMARRPKMLAAFRSLRQAVFDPDNSVPTETLALVGHMASKAAGCQYCVAHTANNAELGGAHAEKILPFSAVLCPRRMRKRLPRSGTSSNQNCSMRPSAPR